MEQTALEQAIRDTLRDVPAKRRDTILQIVQMLVRELKEAARTEEHPRYSVERHRAVRQLTATVDGSLAAAIRADRDQRG